jgi:hypothetical protein
VNWLILHWLGVDNLSGPIYGFWSGFGSDVGEIAIVGVLARVARRMIMHHAQAAQHHRERLDQQAAQHEDMKQHMAAQLNAHCADLKEHLHMAAVPQQLLDDIKRAPRKPGGDRM